MSVVFEFFWNRNINVIENMVDCKNECNGIFAFVFSFKSWMWIYGGLCCEWCHWHVLFYCFILFFLNQWNELMASYNGVECKDSCKCRGNIKTSGGVFGWN